MFEIGVTGQIRAAQPLAGEVRAGARPRGQIYEIEVVVRGIALRPDGILYDHTRLQDDLGALIKDLHDHSLDGALGLSGANTTVETVADRCWDLLAARLYGQGLSSMRVRIQESPHLWAAREDALTP